MKSNIFICASFCLLTCNLHLIAAKTLFQTQRTDPTILQATIDGITIFGTQPPQEKIYFHEQTPAQNAGEILDHYSANSERWYADQCKGNHVLNDLVDTAINFFTDHMPTNPQTQHQRLIVFDIDETLLSPYHLIYQYLLTKDKTALINRKTIVTYAAPLEMTLIYPMYRLYKFFCEKGFKIAVISGRPASPQGILATKEQLAENGFHQIDEYFLRPVDWMAGKEWPACEWKTDALHQLNQKYDVYTVIDDDWRSLTRLTPGTFGIWVPGYFEHWPQEEEFWAKLQDTYNEQNNKANTEKLEHPSS